VKYGRAWWAKQPVLKLIYGDWAKAFKRLPVMLHAMKIKNIGMNFEYVPKPDVMGQEGRQYFFMHYGHLDIALKYSNIVVMCYLLMTRS
jgi:hypothetical protein